MQLCAWCEFVIVFAAELFCWFVLCVFFVSSLTSFTHFAPQTLETSAAFFTPTLALSLPFFLFPVLFLLAYLWRYLVFSVSSVKSQPILCWVSTTIEKRNEQEITESWSKLKATELELAINLMNRTHETNSSSNNKYEWMNETNVWLNIERESIEAFIVRIHGGIFGSGNGTHTKNAVAAI